MGYMHIGNLYKDQAVLLFKEVYVLEKIHGTSAHLSWKQDESRLGFFSGGETYSKFVALFDEAKLKESLAKVGYDVVIFGEAYGGKQQGMSATYGKDLKFIVFDVKIGEAWLTVPKMAEFAAGLGLEVVDYALVPTDQAVLDQHRDADSTQAIRNGVGAGKKREGVVLRPPIEVKDSFGNRIIAKHKRDDFKETRTPRPVGDPAKLAVIEQAQAIADEWVTPMRLQHVVDKLPTDIEGRHCMEQIATAIHAMVEDVYREGRGEIVESKEAERAIGARTAKLFKLYIQGKLGAPVPRQEVNIKSQAEARPTGIIDLVDIVNRLGDGPNHIP